MANSKSLKEDQSKILKIFYITAVLVKLIPFSVPERSVAFLTVPIVPTVPSVPSVPSVPNVPSDLGLNFF